MPDFYDENVLRDYADKTVDISNQYLDLIKEYAEALKIMKVALICKGLEKVIDARNKSTNLEQSLIKNRIQSGIWKDRAL